MSGPWLPLRTLAPLADTVQVTAYTAHQGLFDAAVPHGLRHYWRSDLVTALDEGVRALPVARAWQMTSPRSYTMIFQLGGAMLDVDAAGAVYSGRRGFAVNVNAVWDAGQDPDRECVDRTWALLHPYSTVSA